LLFRLWGIPFLCVAVYLIAGRFFVDAWLRSRTSYYVTDRAAYIVRSAPFGAMCRFYGSALDNEVYKLLLAIPGGDHHLASRYQEN
jgi:hypothetical protein